MSGATKEKTMNPRNGTNRRNVWIAGIAVAGLCFAAASVRSDEKHDHGHAGHDHDHAGMSPEEQHAMWMKLATPGAEHERLQKMVGNWNVSVKAWHGPGEPEVSTGKSVFTSILNGRYIEEHFIGSGADGPFEGKGLHGYDNGKKMHVATWADTMSTKIMIFEGKYDSSGKKLTMYADISTPDGRTMKFRSVSEHVSDDEVKFEMYRTGPDGEEMKGLELIYKRA